MHIRPKVRSHRTWVFSLLVALLCLALLIQEALSTNLTILVKPHHLAAPPPLEQLACVHVLSFATDEKHPMLQLLISTSPYPIKVLGKHQAWRGLRHKFEAVHAYLEAKHLEHSNDIILFMDGYDTAFTKGKQDLIKKFKTFQRPLVISAESACTHHPICSHAIESYPKNPVDTPFKYVNSGTFIGYASAVYAMLDEVLENHPTAQNDQFLLHDYFINHPERAALDYQQSIFSLLYGTHFEDYEVDATGRLINLLTQSQPIILHGNGNPGLLLKLHRSYIAPPFGLMQNLADYLSVYVRWGVIKTLKVSSLAVYKTWMRYQPNCAPRLAGFVYKTIYWERILEAML